MGAGGSQEAAFSLEAGIPAGTYHFVLDCVIIRAVDTTFDLVQRSGGVDTTLITWTQHFEPTPGSFDAQPYEVDMTAPEVVFTPGDQLVFRYTGANTSSSEAWIPNGDGNLSHGRIPNITLPK